MRRLIAVGLLAASTGSTAVGAQSAYPGTHWATLPRAARDKWSADSLRKIGAFVDGIGSGAVVVIQDGALVAQWGEPHRKFPLTSIRKSLLHSLIGLEVARGSLRTDATLSELGIDDDPALTPTERSARVVDLLAARSGIYHESAYEPASMRAGRPARGSAKPGDVWFYNNWDFNALGTIYERVSGSKIFDAFDREIAKPIGMEDYRPADGEYVREPASRHGAYTFRMSASDLARYLLLYSRGGRWGDRQLVPRDWIENGTRGRSDAGDSGMYGLLWWSARGGKLVPNVSLDAGSFAARGNGPHYAIVIPSRQLIIVHLANTDTPSPSNWVERASVGTLVSRILAAQLP
jgi:CubicO group peptidase (beta-lactamase class C family)